MVSPAFYGFYRKNIVILLSDTTIENQHFSCCNQGVKNLTPWLQHSFEFFFRVPLERNSIQERYLLKLLNLAFSHSSLSSFYEFFYLCTRIYRDDFPDPINSNIFSCRILSIVPRACCFVKPHNS